MSETNGKMTKPCYELKFDRDRLHSTAILSFEVFLGKTSEIGTRDHNCTFKWKVAQKPIKPSSKSAEKTQQF